MHVVKIDASILFNAASMDAMLDLCRTYTSPCIFVIASPLRLQTILDNIAGTAAQDSEVAEALFKDFVHEYLALCDDYELDDTLKNRVIELTENLYDLISGVIRIRECSPRSSDCIRSYAVHVASILCEAILQKHGISVALYDSADYIVFDDFQGNVLFSETYKRLETLLQQTAGVHMISGGLGCVQKTEALTCFGTRGADLTASMIAVSQRAKTLTLLGLQPGLFVVDPSLVQGSPVIPELSMQEALELTYFGGHTIYSEALIPLEEHPIDVHINSIHDHTEGGTWIRWKLTESKAHVRGISVMQDFALIVVEGKGMRGVRGMASKLFATLADSSINVAMIIQAASEQSICVGCKMSQAEQAQAALQDTLSEEIHGHRISRISVTRNLAIIGVVGSQMRGQHGIAGAIFSCLGRVGINIVAIVQGSSEVNISFVIDIDDTKEAVQALYTTFFHASA